MWQEDFGLGFCIKTKEFEILLITKQIAIRSMINLLYKELGSNKRQGRIWLLNVKSEKQSCAADKLILKIQHLKKP